MRYEFISITSDPFLSSDRIIKIRTVPSWIEQNIFRKKSEEIEFIGFRRWWRRLPDLEEICIWDGMGIMLWDMAERHDYGEKLKNMGRK